MSESTTTDVATDEEVAALRRRDPQEVLRLRLAGGMWEVVYRTNHEPRRRWRLAVDDDACLGLTRQQAERVAVWHRDRGAVRGWSYEVAPDITVDRRATEPVRADQLTTGDCAYRVAGVEPGHQGAWRGITGRTDEPGGSVRVEWSGTGWTGTAQAANADGGLSVPADDPWVRIRPSATPR